LNAAVNINRYWTVSAQSYYEGERFAKVGTAAVRMSPIIDINLGTSYVYNSWLTGFLKINNLINNKYQHFYGYQNQGFNVLVGATFSF
jgi:outer membrane cobalamin receptor